MPPRGKAKAKREVEENGREKRVRESRNVKAASYKDLSDSEEEKPVRRRKKKDSESEASMSEDEKPKKRGAKKGRKAPARSKKVDSDSEEASDFGSEESSGGESSKKRKPARKPARSLRGASRKTYKDLSNSEDDSNEEGEEDYDSSSEKEEKSSPKGKRGKPLKKVKRKKDESSGSGSEEAEEEVDEEVEEEEDDEDKAEDGKELKEGKPSKEKKSASEETPSDSGVKAKDETEEKKPEEKVEKKLRPEHELSEEEEEADDEDSDDKKGSDSKKRARPSKNGAEKEEDEPQAKKVKVGDKPAMNRTDSDYGSIDFTSEAKTKDGKPWNFKISSWNVAGLKAWIKKNGLEFLKHENPDILCLQETKCSEKKLPSEANVEGYHAVWLSGEKEGYAGVAILSKTKPIDVKYGIGKTELDGDGRVITAEFEKFFLVNVYVPNAGQGLKTLPRRLEWDPTFREYLKKLDEQKPVILCGDMNVAHSEIDLTNPKTNVKTAGFTPQEREGMTQLLKDGFVDTFRNLYPDKTGAYSFWAYFNNARARNIGWRLDYFITSERFLPNVCDNVIRSEVYGSDHCPITLFAHV